MSVPASGTFTLSTIQTGFGGTNPISMSEYYNNASTDAKNRRNRKIMEFFDFH